MVVKNIIETIASYNKEFVHSVVEGRSISKEEVKNFIVDLLGNCGDNEIDYILERLDAEY